MYDTESNWQFKELPFIYKELSEPNNVTGIPNSLPFELSIDKRSGLLKQIPNNIVKSILEKAYQEGSIVGGVITDDTDNIMYAKDFLDFFVNSIDNKTLSEVSVLEIGSGTGYLLSEIKKLGFNVIGVEPGNHCLEARKKYNVEVINSFFPTDEINKKFDFIVMSIVLEHFEDPLLFLEILSSYLKEEGQIILSVPNSEPFILHGDISILFHEHYSYFTNSSLDNLTKLAGYKVLQKRNAKYGGLLFRCIAKGKEKYLSQGEYERAFLEVSNYRNKAELHIDKLIVFLNDILKGDRTLGVYVASRFLNFLLVSGIKFKGLRFFDDNSLIKDKYYPGFNIQIENRMDLIRNPTEIVLIFSNTFGNKIKENLINKLPTCTEIILWDDIF